ncbi:uncharacterized protein LOC111707283 [Eurytemora carolleeae]|uniref:uncharacterized protein LOC111707283 n=1 Tax=Eurytemora carolleeae TaxID=1294199 RepID=UPI000C77EA57|nr:uncharacterized protein LOC111707283 [Eurytemora carolleeae]|eukprot:XP_023336132.1 uncharacterized protein LOC111707283 [Eurytemora affinis]
MKIYTTFDDNKIANKKAYCGTGAMINLIKILKDLEAVSFKRTESASAEQSLDEGSLQSSDEGSDPRIQTLQIIINILDSEQNMGTFLTRFLSVETFAILLKCIRSSRSEEKNAAVSIMSSIASRTGICLINQTDLNILLDLYNNSG